MPVAAPTPAPEALHAAAPGFSAPGGDTHGLGAPADADAQRQDKLRLHKDPLVALADQCVQCGLCLPVCPTYQFARTESESPRGRIALARAWTLELIPPTAAGDTHLDNCLACRKCEAVCPADVQYGALLVLARSRQRNRRQPGWRQAGLEWLAARPAAMGALLGVYRHLFPLLPAALQPLPRPPSPPTDALPAAESATQTVALFSGCVARSYEGGLQVAVKRLLAKLDVAVVATDGQTCCGTLHAHAGNTAEAAVLASRNRDAFAGIGTVLTVASGCHEAVAVSLANVATTTDAIDFIAARADRLRFGPCALRVALHLPCTQRNVVRSDLALRELLARVPGLEVVLVDAGTGCCGAAGSMMIDDPKRAAAYRQPLLEQLAASGATRLLSANIGCRLHLGNGTSIPVQHPLEFLAECLQ